MSQMIVRTFDEESEAEDQLKSNKLTFPSYHHYMNVVDASIVVVREKGQISKLHAGYVDNDKDVYVVIATPEKLTHK